MSTETIDTTLLRPPTEDETLALLVRHAESTWNAEHRFQGQASEVPLSEHGIEQADALGRWLATQGLKRVHIYSSDMLRARHTAEAIARALGGNINYSPALREINVGCWQGLTRDEVEARWPGEIEARDLDIENHRIPGGGECGAELRERAYSFYSELLPKHRGDTLIIVSHGGTLAALRGAIHRWDMNTAWRENRTRLPNTGLTALRYTHPTTMHDLEIAGSLAHLD